MDGINGVVAVNLRALREERRLSLDALSAMTGVSKSMLGMIERGEGNPTISTLWKISDGMKVPFGRFVARQGGLVEVRDKKDIEPLVADESGGYRNYMLFPVDDSRPFEVCRIEIDPGCGLSATPHQSGTQEILTVFSGLLELEVGDRKERLAAGQSIRFFADVRHAYSNPGKKMCVLDMIVAYAL